MARHGNLVVDSVRAVVVSAVDGRVERPCIVHRSMERKSRHGDGRSVAGWLAGCIHCIVEPDQASGGGPDRKYREMSRLFLGVGESEARGVESHRARHTTGGSLLGWRAGDSLFFSTLLHGSRRRGTHVRWDESGSCVAPGRG